MGKVQEILDVRPILRFAREHPVDDALELLAVARWDPLELAFFNLESQ